MNETKIIQRCREYDVGAFKMIYEQYQHPLLRTALKILKQRQDAEDAVQTTFVKLYKGIANFKFQSKFSTYLFRILINTCFDILNKKKKNEASPLTGSDPAYRRDTELLTSIEIAIDKLPTQMRACFILFAVEEFKQKDIARILDLSIGGVKANIYHAKCRLREMLSVSNEEAVV
jgi:RNA polymerase sigma-70 factor (ECF subfamily)